MPTNTHSSHWDQSFSTVMAYLSTFLLLLPGIFLHCLASPARLPRRSFSSASTLVLTASTGTHPVVTFYPSHVSDPSLWSIFTPATIFQRKSLVPKVMNGLSHLLRHFSLLPSPLTLYTQSLATYPLRHSQLLLLELLDHPVL